MYLFDTNTVSELAAKLPNTGVVERFFATRAALRFINTITLQELRFGASLHPEPERIWQKVEREILPFVRVLEFDEEAALAAGKLQAMLRKAGRPISVEDLQIAATALTRNSKLVTRNTPHFRHIPDLQVENWFA